MSKEIEKLLIPITSPDQGQEMNYNKGLFDGYNAAIQSWKVQNVVRMLKLNYKTMQSIVESEGQKYEGFLATNTKRALEEFEGK